MPDTETRLRMYNAHSRKVGTYPVDKVIEIATKHGKRTMAIGHDEEGRQVQQFVSKTFTIKGK